MTKEFFAAELIRVGDSQGVLMKLFGEEIVKTGFDTKADASRAIELACKVLKTLTEGILTQMRADIDASVDNAPDDISAGKAAYRTANDYFDKVFDLPPMTADEGTAEQAEGLSND